MKVSALVLALALVGPDPLAASLLAVSADHPAQYTRDTACIVPSLIRLDRVAVVACLRSALVTVAVSQGGPMTTPISPVAPLAAAASAMQVPAAAPFEPSAPPVEPLKWWRWLWLLWVLIPLFVRKLLKDGSASEALAEEMPPLAAIAPHVIFVPRLDAGRQVLTTIDARDGHSFEIVYHTDPGKQTLHYRNAPEADGAES
jgi:hypothetical protein